MNAEKPWPPANEDILPWTGRHSQRRHIWLLDADRLVTEANEMADTVVSHPYCEKQAKQVRKAARLFLKSAQFYKQAGLGLQAITSYQDAADCYARLGDDEQCEKCEEFAEAIETYWEED
jgi:hypothetical protein